MGESRKRIDRSGRVRLRARGVLALLALAAAMGCVSVRYPHASTVQAEGDPWGDCSGHYREEIEDLTKTLLSMGGSADEREAGIIARVAVCHSMELANRYELTWPPLLHNMMVNAGMRQRGLCFHFTNDLIMRLHSLRMRCFEFYRAVAYKKQRGEHNCVVVTTVGGGFDDGLVLDAWRKSGKVYAVPVRDDSYPWQPRFPMR
ncbi:MAG: hypothetical protein JXA20_01070 [Spirochaetes bacterium]|nr:hypothetical protein [Spirochaetota bacterium]